MSVVHTEFWSFRIKFGKIILKKSDSIMMVHTKWILDLIRILYHKIQSIVRSMKKKRQSFRRGVWPSIKVNGGLPGPTLAFI